MLALCQAVGASVYVNAIGGVDLYSKDEFRRRGIALRFVRSKPLGMPNSARTSSPWLSMVDVMMFNSLDAVRGWVETNYELI